MRDENQLESARVTPAGAVRKFVFTMAAVSGAVGLIVLIGWHAHIRAMVQIRPGLSPMRYNASLCLVISAAALAAFAFGRLRIAQIGGLLAVLFSAWTFGEHSIHVQHGIDEFFFKHLVGGPISDAGRMADLSAISYFLTGAALLLACESSSSRLAAAGDWADCVGRLRHLRHGDRGIYRGFAGNVSVEGSSRNGSAHCVWHRVPCVRCGCDVLER